MKTISTTWTILGPGAIGGLLACQLSRAGIPVQLITSRTTAEPQVKPQGMAPEEITLGLREADRETRFRFPQPAADAIIRHLIITTKTWQTRAAFDGIRDRLDEQSTLIVMQNGMGTADWLQAQLPQAVVLAATTTQGAYRENRTTIVHAGQGDTWLGPLRKAHEPKARAIYTQWQQQGLPIQWDHSIAKRLWLKLGINCVINPLTVIYQCRNGELLQNPEALQQMAAIAEEFTRVYRGVFGTTPDEDMFSLAREVAHRTAANISSMRQDALNDNPTEINAINGYLVERGQALGIQCPVNTSVINALKHITAHQ